MFTSRLVLLVFVRLPVVDVEHSGRSRKGVGIEGGSRGEEADAEASRATASMLQLGKVRPSRRCRAAAPGTFWSFVIHQVHRCFDIWSIRPFLSLTNQNLPSTFRSSPDIITVSLFWFVIFSLNLYVCSVVSRRYQKTNSAWTSAGPSPRCRRLLLP